MDTLTYVSRDTMSEIAEAIRSRNGKENTYKPTQMATAISALRKDSAEGVSDVVFRDYDGTVLYSYTLEELAELTELPDLPSHDGLICQGWNWTLEKLQAFNKPITVGAKYITDDGTTRLHIKIATKGRMDIPLYYTLSSQYNVTIDWGDGSNEVHVSTSADLQSLTHTYADPGDYTITLTPSGGKLGLGGYVYNSADTIYYGVLGLANDPTGGTPDYIYLNMLQSVEIGSCVTSIGAYAFDWCYSLASVTIPDSVTSIGAYAFDWCYSLASVTIPDSVTSIGEGAFYCCYGMAEYHVKATTPPTLASTNVFLNIPDDCVIYVPSGYLSAYKSATNWSTYASYMQEEEE